MSTSDRLTVGCLATDTSYVNSTPWSAGNIVRLFGKLALDKVRPRLGGDLPVDGEASVFILCGGLGSS